MDPGARCARPGRASWSADRYRDDGPLPDVITDVVAAQQRMREAREYDEAMRRFLGRAPVRLKPAGKRYPSRADLHDRTGLR